MDKLTLDSAKNNNRSRWSELIPINKIFRILLSIFLINIESTSDLLDDNKCSNANEYFSFEINISASKDFTYGS